MKKKITAIFLAATMAFSFVSCGEAKTDEGGQNNNASGNETSDNEGEELSEQPMEISIYTFSGSMTDDLQAAIDWLADEMPNVTVTLTSDAGPKLRENMQVNAASGTMPDMWCMFGGTIGDYYTGNGLVYDLSDYAAEHHWEDLYMESVLDLCQLDGILAGYPATYNSLEVLYRKDIFEQAGITELPTTIAEFEDCMAKIKAIDITPITVGGATQANPMRIFQALLENYAGPQEHDSLMSMETSWTSDSVIAALNKFQEWVELGYFPDGYLSINQADNLMTLGSGMAAMMIDGPGMATQLAANGYDVNDFGYFKFPQDNNGRISSYAQMYMFSKDISEEKLHVLMTLLDYCYSEENIAARGNEFTYPLCFQDAKMPTGFEVADTVSEDVTQYGTYLISDQALPQAVVTPLYAAMDYIGSGEMNAEETAAYMQQCIDDFKAGE